MMLVQRTSLVLLVVASLVLTVAGRRDTRRVFRHYPLP